jgi:hypothetical protein
VNRDKLIGGIRLGVVAPLPWGAQQWPETAYGGREPRCADCEDTGRTDAGEYCDCEAGDAKRLKDLYWEEGDD